MKKIKLVLLGLLISFFAVSCSSGAGKGEYYEPGGDGNQINGGALGENNIVIPQGHKIIYTVEYKIYIEEAIAPTIKEVNDKVYTLNGYVSSSSESLSYAEYVYKVPTENLNAFLDSVDAIEGVSNKEIKSEDVTTSYNEVTAEIETLEASKLAYQNMLKDENLSLNEIMSLNDKITSIESKLKTLYKNLDNLNSRVDYATITIKYTLSYAPPKEVFLGDYGDFLITLGKTVVEILAYSAPFIVVAGIGVGVVFIVKKSKKKKESK